VPITLISNDPTDIQSFLQSFPAGIIYKPLTWLASLDGRMLFTNSISEQQIVEGKDSIKFAPGIYQERLQKRYEYRVTIIDSHVFSVRIHSQQLDATSLDWRRNQEDVVYDVVELPVSLTEKLIRLNRKLGLRYSAIDLVESPDNGFVFLEANPSGNWLWLEKRIGIPVSAALGTALSNESDT
jgi:glutathione synthase/RimK-type ligase-like ATP-grasp enzyme